MSRKRKMSTAEKQRRRERRAARRRSRVETRTPEQQERLERTRAEMVFYGHQAFERLRKRAQKVHRGRMA